MRSVPLLCEGEVRIHSAPNDLAAEAILSSSAAIITLLGNFARQACSQTCWMRNLPVSLARTLPANLVEP